MATKKISLNELRNIVKQIIKEETMLNESTSNLLAVLEKLQKSEISGQKETFDKSPEKLVNEIKSLLDKYFKGNVKSLPNGNTYWYIKNQEPFLTITGHDDGKGNGLKANIGIVKELQKIDDYLKYQEVYGEVMRAYIVDNNLTTTNKFWMFDKLPNQLHSSELGIQTSGQQQPVSEGTKKITMNGLRSIVKQIIKEETMLNEDNLVLNNYAKQLYSLFKKEGATPLITTGKNYASPDIKNYNVSIMVTNNGELHVGIKGVNKANAEKYANLVSKQFQDLQLKGNINFGTGWGGEQDSYADLTLIPKTTKKGGEVNPNQRPNAPKPQAQQQQPVSENLRLRNYFK